MIPSLPTFILLTIVWLVAGLPDTTRAQTPPPPDAQPSAKPSEQPPESPATVRLRANKALAKEAQDSRRMRPTVEDPDSELVSVDLEKHFGTHANLKTHHASVFDRNTQCSATLIGPGVALTAAHCAEGDDHIFFTLGGKDYSAFCKIFSGRDTQRGTGDWALCRVEQDGGVQNIPLFETLNHDSSLIKIDAKVLLTGFGFSNIVMVAGTFGRGGATIIETPSATSDEIVTVGATTTPGDSGSAAFMLNAARNRRIVGVNSNRNAMTATTPKSSSASSISTETAVKFIKAWMKNHPTLAVCGYTAGAAKCQP
jgi:V8-like Glu-specific endopeptidase